MKASSSRTTGLAVGFLALLALALWFVVGGRGDRSGGVPRGSAGVPEGALAESTGSLSAPIERGDGEERERDSAGLSEPSRGEIGSSAAPEAGPAAVRADDWRRCFTEPDPIRVRECVRAQLGGRILSPEELARMVCSGAPPDAASRLLIGIVAADWPATELASDVLAFQSLCDSSPTFWTSFLRERIAEDSDYGRAFAASLRGRLLTEAKGTALLEMAAELAEGGNEEVRQMLVRIARGEGGGSAVQVAFALAWTSHWTGNAADTIEFLSDVLSARTLPRSPEVGAELARILLRKELIAEDPDRVGLLLGRLLADGGTGPAAAKVLLDAERFGTLPRGLPDDVLQELLATAR